MIKLIKYILISVASISMADASGWKIPEQSVRSTATAGAYGANASGADTSYYNPANMSFNSNQSEFEINLNYIHLSSVEYVDNTDASKNSRSEKENFYIPTLFYSSKEYYDNLRFGFAFTAPGGLAKRWESTYAKAFAQEFSLRIVELNPSMAYRISSDLSFGLGARIILSDGVVKSDATTLRLSGRDMPGDMIMEYGYNLALAYKPTKFSNLGITYRSNVDLTQEGNAKLFNATTTEYYSADVTVPLPATLVISYSQDIENSSVEFTYEKSYWSRYKVLDFDYSPTISTTFQTFDTPISKNWKDTIAYRFGFYHQYSDDLKLMAGFAIDEAPEPDSSMGFELPENDARIYSAGFDYKLQEDSSFGFAYLFYDSEDAHITNTTGIDGTFSNINAHLVSVAYRKSF
jgi:long-chain fatty acid transport protein